MRTKFLELLSRRKGRYRPARQSKPINEKLDRILNRNFVLAESVSNFTDNLTGLRYAVVGGHAVSFHSKPRTTQDIDILIDPNDLNDALDRMGNQIATPLIGTSGTPIGGMSVKVRGVDVDFIVYDAPWVSDALSNTVPSKMGNLISKPYLVVMKIDARRGPQDDTDAINVIATMGQEEKVLARKLVDRFLPNDLEDFDSMVEIAEVMGGI